MTTLPVLSSAPIKRRPSATLHTKANHPDWVLCSELTSRHWVIIAKAKVNLPGVHKPLYEYLVFLWDNFEGKQECTKYDLSYASAEKTYVEMVRNWAEYFASGLT